MYCTVDRISCVHSCVLIWSDEWTLIKDFSWHLVKKSQKNIDQHDEFDILHDKGPDLCVPIFHVVGDPLENGGAPNTHGAGGIGLGEQGIVSQEIDANKVMLPVLVIACNRPTVSRNLDQLLK